MFVNDVRTVLDNHAQKDANFLDISKVFDTVPHTRPMSKLIQLKLNERVIIWIYIFLTNRTQYVYVNNTFSPITEVTSDVP